MGPSIGAPAGTWLLQPVSLCRQFNSSKKASHCPPQSSGEAFGPDLTRDDIFVRNKPHIFLTVQSVFGQRLSWHLPCLDLTLLCGFPPTPKAFPFHTTFSHTHFSRYLNAFCEHYPVKQTPIISFHFLVSKGSC